MKLDENLSSCFQRGAAISRRFPRNPTVLFWLLIFECGGHRTDETARHKSLWS